MTKLVRINVVLIIHSFFWYFNVIDFLGNGYIPTSSLREILAALDDQLTNDQLDEMIAEIDTDSSGTVDFEG